uniref:Uncharacterized protein n=1 Tax=Rhizophora mucronata TaxID=61149 RepID=A0A2P2Q1P4_RHIMU
MASFKHREWKFNYFSSFFLTGINYREFRWKQET